MVQTLYPEGGAVYQQLEAPIHTQQELRQNGLMKITHGLHSNQI